VELRWLMRMRLSQDAKTIFKRMFYDAERDQSVVHCRSNRDLRKNLDVH
jgi:hypothetical protein